MPRLARSPVGLGVEPAGQVQPARHLTPEPQPILTTDNGRFIVGRARLAPAMISTPGSRGLQMAPNARPCQPGVIKEQLQAARSNPPTTRLGSVQCRAERKHSAQGEPAESSVLRRGHLVNSRFGVYYDAVDPSPAIPRPS